MLASKVALYTLISVMVSTTYLDRGTIAIQHIFSATLALDTTPSYGGRDQEIVFKIVLTNLRDSDQSYQRLNALGKYITITDQNGTIVHPDFQRHPITGFVSWLAADKSDTIALEPIRKNALPPGIYEAQARIPVKDINGIVLDTIVTNKVNFSIAKSQ